MAFAADFAVEVSKGGHGKMVHPLVLVVAAMVLHELAGGFVEGRRSWLKGLYLNEQLELGRARNTVALCRLCAGTGVEVSRESQSFDPRSCR
jgi:hypothetical protein